MKTITATHLARNLSQVLDDLQRTRQEVHIERNGRPVGRLVPDFNAEENLAMLRRISGRLTPEEGAAYEAEIERVLDVIDPRGAPWESS